MMGELSRADLKEISNIINIAALAYKGKISADRWKDPYMPTDELCREMENGVQFYGWRENNLLVAVMGIQFVKDVTLIRHAYVLPSYQRKQVGAKLLNHLLSLAPTSKVYVGTWEAAWWAVKFYQKYGFKLVSSEEKNKLLKRYWSIPERQIETSVVLKLERPKQ